MIIDFVVLQDRQAIAKHYVLPMQSHMQISHLLFLQNRTQSNYPSRTFYYRFEQRWVAVLYIKKVSFILIILGLSL